MTSDYKIGIIGYGKMGSEIFSYLLPYALDIILYSKNLDKLAHAEKKYSRFQKRLLKRGVHDFSNSKCVDNLSYLYDCNIIIENIKEDFAAKVELFKKLSKNIHPDTILTSNTSSLSLKSLSESGNLSNNFCGMHFFYPVKLINLIEIIKAPRTSLKTINTLQSFAEFINKEHIVVEDAPASVINCVLSFYYIEAIYLLQEGNVLPSTIDEVAKRYFYIGPCESLDVIGLDFFSNSLSRVALTSRIVNFTNNEIWNKPVLLYSLLEQGRTGKNSGAGIYHYDDAVNKEDEIQFYKKTKNLQAISEDEIASRLFYAIINGALVATNANLCDDNAVDTGIKNVLFMDQGPITYMRSQGMSVIENNLSKLARKCGQRFALYRA